MAKIFEAERIVPVWLEASQHLQRQHSSEMSARNLVLEVQTPNILTHEDCVAFDEVDVALRDYASGLNVKTVAATIFPQALYLRHGRHEMYKRYAAIMKRAKVKGTWGTYAARMMAWPNGTSLGVNQLEQTILKLDRAAHHGTGYKSVFEVGTTDPIEDSEQEAMHDIAIEEDIELGDAEMPCEVSTFHPVADGKKIRNMPCLSHISFKLTDKAKVDLTAVYRSHHYAARALGNLLGLSQLLSFVAKESRLEPGVMTVISTHAVLDAPSWGGKPATEALLKTIAARYA
ncbi:hypothetical protein [Burkholderia cepacia]|uniref:hypothetical protein n=1 Tax=Burkholderia cepacia TaxID=292 RepID=UPI000F58F2FE|nr:hypothetical protein [Burkholderia cepacia]